MRSTSMCIHDSCRVPGRLGGLAARRESPADWPCASRCTASTGCTIRCSDRPWRLISMVVLSTRKGMSSLTTSITEWREAQPCSATRRADHPHQGRAGAGARRRTARAPATRRAGPRACARPCRRCPGGGTTRAKASTSGALGRLQARRRKSQHLSVRSRRAVSIDWFMGSSPIYAACAAGPALLFSAMQLTPAPTRGARYDRASLN